MPVFTFLQEFEDAHIGAPPGRLIAGICEHSGHSLEDSGSPGAPNTGVNNNMSLEVDFGLLWLLEVYL